jgi:hypothetical protein
MAGRRYDRVLAAKREPSYPLRPATGTSATKTVPERETEQCPLSRAIVSPQRFKNQTREFAHLEKSLAVKRVRNIGTL